MRRICVLVAIAGLLALSATAGADIVSDKLATLLKNNQVDCDGDGTKELCKDTWRSSPNPTGWDEYSLVVNANVMAGLKLYGDTIEADNAVNYFFVTNKNWAKKTQEEAIVGAGGSAFYADSSYTGEDSWGKAWGFHGQDYSATGRNSSPEGMDNMIIGTYDLAIAGYNSEASLLADAIVAQTTTGQPWTNNEQYWDATNNHICYPDAGSWQNVDELMSTAGLMRAMQIITDGGGKDYSATITAINNWHGGYGTSWDDAIDEYFDLTDPVYGQYFDHYDDIYKLIANWDAISAQNLANNFDSNNPYFSYAIANVWAIHALKANGQEDAARAMRAALISKYWDGSDVTGYYKNRCRGALLMANEIAPVPEPLTMLLFGGSILGGLAAWKKRRRMV